MRSRKEIRGSKALQVFGKRRLKHLFLKQVHIITITEPRYEQGKFYPGKKLWIPSFIFKRI